MALTRIDCDFFRGKAARTDNSSYVALNPSMQPGNLVVAGARAARSNLGGQIACKLALEHFVTAVLESAEVLQTRSNCMEGERCQFLLENAFKRANTSVYNFGHKLAAGGRMAAGLIALVIENESVAAGKVGDWSAFLYRDNELYPFFEDEPATSKESVGSQSLVKIETASVSIVSGDSILLLSHVLSPKELIVLKGYIDRGGLNRQHPGRFLAESVFDDSQSVALAMVATVGPDAVLLTELAG